MSTKITVYLIGHNESRTYVAPGLVWQVMDSGTLKIKGPDAIGNQVVVAWFQSSEWRWFEVHPMEEKQ